MTALTIISAIYLVFTGVAVWIASLAFKQAKRTETEWWYRAAMYSISGLYVLAGGALVFLLVVGLFFRA